MAIFNMLEKSKSIVLEESTWRSPYQSFKLFAYKFMIFNDIYELQDLFKKEKRLELIKLDKGDTIKELSAKLNENEIGIITINRFIKNNICFNLPPQIDINKPLSDCTYKVIKKIESVKTQNWDIPNINIKKFEYILMSNHLYIYQFY